MVFDLYKNDNCLKENNLYKKLFAEIPDLFFQLVIKTDGSYSFPFVSKLVEDIFELSNEDFQNNTELILHGRIFHLDKQYFFDTFLTSKKDLKI